MSTDRSRPPVVSALIPCRNEAEFIAKCLNSVLANGYPLERLEILVVDGCSTDGTREVVSASAAAQPIIRVMDNPDRITPRALNIGIASAAGDVIIRLDAHATYERGYIAGCVEALDRYGADNTGGVWNIVPRREGIVGRAIACALTHHFGGAARYRRAEGSEPEFVDLVPFFCCRRETLSMIGPFNENLLRHQDFEHSTRMRRAGLRFLLVPAAVCNYYTRSDLKSFWLHSFRDGLWVTLAAAYTDVVPFSIRHLIPMLFAVGVLVGLLAAPFSTVAAGSVGVVLAAYVAAAVCIAAQIAGKERDLRMLAVMPVVFFGRHLLFGLGAALGAVRDLIEPEFWRHHRMRLGLSALASK